MPLRNPYTFGVTLFAAIDTFLFGYDSSIATTIIAFPSWNAYMSQPSPSLIGGISSAYSAGEACGLLQTLIANRLGRIHFLQLLCVIILLGTCVQTASTGIGMSIAGRAIEYEKGREFVGYLALFGQYRRRILAAIAVALMAILTGAPVVGFYQTILYRALGIQQDNILILAAARGILSLIAVLLINRFLLDQWGRRQLLLWGMAISTAILVYCAVMQKTYQDSDNQVGKVFAVLGIFAQAFFDGGALESVCPIYNAEILPIALRSKVMGIAGFIFFSVTVAFTEAAPSAFANIKQNYYYVFVGCTVVMWIIGYYWFPETKGRTLEEIAAAFGDRVVDVPREDPETNMVLVEETKGGDVRVTDQEAGVAV